MQYGVRYSYGCVWELGFGFGFFFFFLRKKKRVSCVAVIVPRPTVQLGKPMDTTSSNWSSETPNPHTRLIDLDFKLIDLKSRDFKSKHFKSLKSLVDLSNPNP